MNGIIIMAVNKVLAGWGIILLIGFVLTHFMISFDVERIVFWAVWGSLIVSGLIIGRSSKHKHPKVNEGFRMLWKITTLIGALLTLGIVVNIVPVPGYYIMSLWLILMGSSLISIGLTLKGPIETSVGLIWLTFGFIILTTIFQVYHFFVAGIVFGVPMIIMGVYSKHTV